MDDRIGLGQSGERDAERFLKRLKYRIVTRNYRCPAGEIDLIALDKGTIVFVEVKTRTGRQRADPEEAVRSAKQRHIVRAAEFFLRQTGSEERAYRFDVIGVILSPDGQREIEHLVDVFLPA